MFTTARGAAAVRFMKTAMQSANFDLLICLLWQEFFTSRPTIDRQGGSHFCFLHSAQHHSGTIVILGRFYSINAIESNSHSSHKKQTNIKTNKCKNAIHKQTNKQRTSHTIAVFIINEIMKFKIQILNCTTSSASMSSL